MKKRAITALIILVFTPILIFDKVFIFFQIALGILALIAVYELFRMFEESQKVNWVLKLVTYLLTIGLFIVVGNVWHGAPNVSLVDLSFELPIIFMGSFILIAILLILIPSINGKVMGMVLLIINYVGLGFGAISLLRTLGVKFIIYAMLVTVLTDTFAYLFGVKFGKHKMSPNISPKKSWEGAIAGTVFATVIATLFAVFYGSIFKPGGILNEGGTLTLLDGVTGVGTNDYYQPVLWKQGLILLPITALLSVIGQLGDLFASKLKRTYEIKDFGKIFPGHGGVLDRFDSLMFVAIALLIIMRIFQLGSPLPPDALAYMARLVS